MMQRSENVILMILFLLVFNNYFLYTYKYLSNVEAMYLINFKFITLGHTCLIKIESVLLDLNKQ